jgi:SAM-dependent methyltransferase
MKNTAQNFGQNIGENIGENIVRHNIRYDLEIISYLIKPKSKVLDIGCGNGELLEFLKKTKNVDGRGLEISQKSISTINSLSTLIESMSIKLDTESDEDVFIPNVAESQVTNIQVNEIKNKESNDWSDELLNNCKTLYNSHSLKEGQAGWSYSKIFDPIFFIGADKIRIIEPYLFKSHQLRNLQDLLLLIVESAKPKIIEVFTLPPPIEWQKYNSKFFDTLIKEIFNSHGVTLDIQVSTQLHDRYIFSSSGYVAKLGRGLDIFKPSTGLAAHRQESRKVRACEISIFKN